MMSRSFLFLLLVLTTVAAHSLTYRSTMVIACSPTPTPIGFSEDYSTAMGRTKAADVVLEGTVTVVTRAELGMTLGTGDTATVVVHRYFKGNGPATVTIKGFGPGVSCRTEVDVGDHRIFYAQGTSPGQLQIPSLYSTHAVDAVDPPTIAEIIEVTGQPSEPHEQNGMAGLGTEVLLIGLGVLVVVIAFLRRSR